jgi:hypothetical protein
MVRSDKSDRERDLAERPGKQISIVDDGKG